MGVWGDLGTGLVGQLFEAFSAPHNKNLLPTGLGLKKYFIGSCNWKKSQMESGFMSIITLPKISFSSSVLSLLSVTPVFLW
jgi:hypothetical protein